MKKDRRIYRITTGIVTIVMLYSIFSFTLFDHAIYPEGAFQHLHLPGYFQVELTVAKTLGLVALLVPAIPFKIKEFAYFGFAITLVSAIIAHSSVGDKWYNIADPLGFLVVLIISYIYFLRIRTLRQTQVRQRPENQPYYPAKQAL
ncbi:DoxX family protein [Flavitalea sp. BT771]|uniref:DoxX family protein n=1 Tax=Flavitalea sp. BT771 TaxID=3063329 RepID=UPI0026E49484|nr:DoxX family protein [Flavitalea sp. BT771]MDO6432250.1 DoxX family protein [Flavitalea sp. BT771]MDV6221160.1 DoxX family protein [Flavitalea sp. BT771]